MRAPPSSVPVTATVVEPAPSETLVGSTERVTLVDAASLSLIVRVAESTFSPFAVPLTVSVSAPSAMSSSVGINAKVCVPSVWLAGMVSVKLLTVSKSVPAVAVPLSTDTVTAVALVDAPPSRVPVTVTVVEPAPSETLVGSTERVTFVDIVSLSLIVRVAESTFSPFAVPLTVSVSAPSAMSSSVGINAKVCVPSVWLAGMVSVKLLTVSKSAPAMAVPLSTDTVTGVALARAPSSRVPVTVTVVEPAPSETAVGFTDRVTLVDAVSSSVMVIVAESTASPVALPVTDRVSSVSSTSSFVGIRSNVVVPRVSLAGMVSVKSLTVAKSVPAIAVPFSTDIVTGVSLSRATLLRVPATVTLVEPAPSETLSGPTDNVTIVETGGGDGPSRMVTSRIIGSPATNPSGRLPNRNCTLSSGST